MIDEAVLRSGLACCLESTHFTGVGELVRGKVRDSYRLVGGQRAIVVTDRVSAFDCVLGTVPFKGQVLNGISSYVLEATADVVDNHLIEVIDPSVSLVCECAPFPIEVVVRGYLSGRSPTSLWTLYSSGKRCAYGHCLPEGLVENERLENPLVTPTTKGAMGAHDLPISRVEIVERGLVDEADLAFVYDAALQLYARGQAMAAERGLILVDTKYEFGRREDGRIVVIDEVHTPDSSRYWLKSSYADANSRGVPPTGLDKEFLRQRLLDAGFSGGGEAPELDDETRLEVARRYIGLYELITGKDFEPDLKEPARRVENVLRAMNTR